MMPLKNTRLIARLDIKGAHLIKSIQLEGLRVIGDPRDYARRYYEQGADEIIYIDAVASLYGRNKLTDIVRHTAQEVFIPLTVGGGCANWRMLVICCALERIRWQLILPPCIILH